MLQPLFTVEGFIDGVIYEDGQIIFCLVQDAYPYNTLIIKWASPDGNIEAELEIPWQFTGMSDIAGFDLTEEGYFQFLIRNRRILQHRSGEVRPTYRPGLNALLYVVYDRQGNVVVEPQMVLDLEAEGIRGIWQTLFLPSGDILLQARMETAELTEIELMLYILTPDETLRKEWPVFGNLVMLRDGSIFGITADGLLEFDPIMRRFEDDPALSPLDEEFFGIFLYPSPQGSEFDFYRERFRRDDNTWWLYGHHLDTGAFTPIMLWPLAREHVGIGGQVIPLADGRFAAFHRMYDMWPETQGFYVFTP